MQIQQIVDIQKRFFYTHITKPISFRLEALARLGKSIHNHEGQLIEALAIDLHKSSHESFMSEIGMVYEELRYHETHLKKWMKPEPIMPTIGQQPSKLRLHRNPYGVVLIISPWNYPVLLSLTPLIGAISAGNCVVLKPSNYAPTVSSILEKIIIDAFEIEHVATVLGGREEHTTLLQQEFDYMFFTGSTTVGKIVMKAAAEKLIPVTLELGGKSPTIVDETADIPLAARRILFGKILNAGQTCIAPDYILVDQKVEEHLITSLIHQISVFLGPNPISNLNYPKIINRKHFDRLLHLLQDCNILHGGESEYPFIAPTLVRPKTLNGAIMQEEIFGPILPIISVSSPQEAFKIISERPTPLALYLFSRNISLWKHIERNISFGGGCINDTIMHIANVKSPFGGVGASGIGSYHGKRSFDTFSHTKTLLYRSSRIDPTLRYHPYTKTKAKLIQKVLSYRGERS